MPSGMVQQDSTNVDPKVIDQGMTLAITVKWPDSMFDVEGLFNTIHDDKPLSDDMMRSKMNLEITIQEMKGSIKKRLSSTFKIPLPFAVCDKIDIMEYIGHDNGMDVLFAMLKAPMKDFLNVGIKKKRRFKSSS